MSAAWDERAPTVSPGRLALGSSQFRLLWASWSAALMGETLLAVTVMIVVYEQSGSALRTLGVVLATRLPPVLLGPFAGRWVGAVAKPARLATIPRVVPRAGLVAANGLVATSTQAAGALGYVVGGLLVVNVGMGVTLGITVTCFLAAALLALALRVAPVADSTTRVARSERLGLRARLRGGWRAAQAQPVVRDLLLMEVVEWFPHAMWTAALMLAFTNRALGGSSAWWTWQNAAFYAGTLLGAVLATSFAGVLGRRAGAMIVGNGMLFALLTLCYAWVPTLPAAVALAFLFGPTSTLRDVAQDALLQAKVAGDRLGRVLAFRAAGTNMAFLLAAPAFAWAADHAPVRVTYSVGAALYLATALFAALSPSIRSARVTINEAGLELGSTPA